MSTHLYLSMTPESLVASMLSPTEFGHYMAVGTKRTSYDQVTFFELNADAMGDAFDLSMVAERCVPHVDGQPKHSLYLAIYRVLERISWEALGSLWLVTAKGECLELKQADRLPKFSENWYLYQELCPVHPLVVSSLCPPEFRCLMTDRQKAISVPRICFVDLRMGGLAQDPENAQPSETFFPGHFYHLKECLLELKRNPEKVTKTVDRLHPESVTFHFVQNGFYVGDQERLLYYPFPSRGELEGKYYRWWRRSGQY